MIFTREVTPSIGLPTSSQYFGTRLWSPDLEVRRPSLLRDRCSRFISPNAGGNTKLPGLLRPGEWNYQPQTRANPEAEMNPGHARVQHVQVPSRDVHSNTDVDPGVPVQAQAHMQSASANSAPYIIETVSQAHVEEMARLILLQINEIRKKPVAVPESLQAGVRASAFLEDWRFKGCIRSDCE